MRRVGTLLLASFLLVSRPGLAQEGAGARLYGSWRLVSFQMQVVGEDAPPRDVFGPNPFGRLILTPEHTMAAYLSRPDRRPPSNEAEAATLLASMNAYTGRFRVSGAFGPFSGPLDDQPLFAAAQRQGISSSMRLWGQPLTRRVSTSRK
jgi:hypothetical protein